jgi:hypothetical protein
MLCTGPAPSFHAQEFEATCHFQVSKVGGSYQSRGRIQLTGREDKEKAFPRFEIQDQFHAVILQAIILNGTNCPCLRVPNGRYPFIFYGNMVFFRGIAVIYQQVYFIVAGNTVAVSQEASIGSNNTEIRMNPFVDYQG